MDGNRWLAYAALALVLLVLVRSRARGARGAGGARAHRAWASGSSCSCGCSAATPGDSSSAGRLNEPLGYINGMGGFFLLGAWLCVAAAERARAGRRRARERAARRCWPASRCSRSRAASRSRPAVSCWSCVLAVPGRARRGWALLVDRRRGGRSPAPALLDVYTEASDGDAAGRGRSSRRAAARRSSAAAGGGRVGRRGLARRHGGPAAGAARVGAAALAGGAVLVAAAVGVASAGRIADTLDRQYTRSSGSASSRRAARQPRGDSRLVTGAGNRYDYWRVAWHAWRDAAGARRRRGQLRPAVLRPSARRPRTSGSRTPSSSSC